MKRPILYAMLFLALTATLSSCEEDPAIPTVNYRKVTTQITANLPEGLIIENLRYHYRFCIDQCLYIYGEYRQNIDGNTPLRGVLYEYNTNTNKWDIAWYVSSQEVQKLYNSGKEEDYRKAEQLIQMTDLISNCTDRSCCGYNGKGYIYTNVNKTLEFDPSTKTMAIYDNTSQMNDVRVFSKAKGILAIDKSSNSLYQYSTDEHIWKFVADIINDTNSILRLLTGYYDILDSPKEDKLYIWNSGNDYHHSIDSYAYPYASIQQKQFVEVPHDYGWSDYIDIIPQSEGYSASTFTINGKFYIISDNQTYYEYNPADNTISLIIEDTNMDYSVRYLLVTIGNKLYFTSGSQIGYIAF